MASKKMDDFLARGRAEAVDVVKNGIIRGRNGGPIASVRRNFASLGNTASGAVADVTILAKAAFFRPQPDGLQFSSDDAAAQFDEAQQAYGRDDAYLADIQDNKHRTFLLLMAFFFGLVAVDIATWASYINNIFFVIGHVAPLLPVAILAMTAAFHNWQIRKKRLGGLLDFARKPSEWWPEPSVGKPLAKSRLPALFVLLASGAIAASIFMGSPGGAVAQTANSNSVSVDTNALFATPATTDIWYNLLMWVFPGVGPIGSGSSSNPISVGIANALGTLIACLMAVAAVAVSWQIVVGIVETSHSGELLGKKYHTLWAPIRLVYGFGSLAPIVKGYCLLQILILWVAIVSGQIGNLMWSQFTSNLTSGTLSVGTMPESMDMFKGIFKLEVCYALENQNLQNTASSSSGSSSAQSSLFSQPYRDASATPPSNGNTELGAAAAFSVANGGSAIGVTYVPQNNDTAVYTWGYGDCGQISGSFRNDTTPTGILQQAQVNAINTLRDSLQKSAQTVAQIFNANSGQDIMTQLGTTGTPLWIQLIQAKTAYDTTVGNAVCKFVNQNSSGTPSGTDAGCDSGTPTSSSPSSNSASGSSTSCGSGTSSSSGNVDNAISSLQGQVNCLGWASAGMYYMTVARINSKMVSATQNMPKIKSLLPPQGRTIMGVSFSNVNNSLEKWWNANSFATNNGLTPEDQAAAVAAARVADDGHVGESQGDSWYSYVLAKLRGVFSSNGFIVKHLMNMVTLSPSTMDGLQQEVDLGDYLITAAETALGIGAVLSLSGVSDVLGNIRGGAGAAMSYLSLFVGLLTTTLLMAGVYDALILPMTPALYFTFALLGILITTAESVVAAPLWAFIHIRMDGAEFMDGPQSAGYKILFSLLFRIPLTLLGLMLSLLIFDAGVWLLSVTIYPAIASATSESTFGLVGCITMMVAISLVNYELANRSFHLITDLPERVSRWFGGEGVQGEGGHASKVFGAVASTGKQAGAQAAQAISGKQKEKDNNNNNGGGGGGGGGRGNKILDEASGGGSAVAEAAEVAAVL